jgi:hypothetical protein
MIAHLWGGCAVPHLFSFCKPGRRAGLFTFGDPQRPAMINWYTPCAYDTEVKQRYHAAARVRLRQLAKTLGFQPGSFDLRSNPGGIAVMWNAH